MASTTNELRHCPSTQGIMLNQMAKSCEHFLHHDVEATARISNVRNHLGVLSELWYQSHQLCWAVFVLAECIVT